MFRYIFFSTLCVFSLSGCSMSLSNAVEPLSKINDIMVAAHGGMNTENKAKITFLRQSNNSQEAYKKLDVYVYDFSGKSAKLIGVIPDGKKLESYFQPGEYYFAVISKSSVDFIKANITAHNEYYSVVNQRFAGYKFSAYAVKHGEAYRFSFTNPDVKRLNESLQPIMLNDSTYRHHLNEIVQPELDAALDKHFRKWQSVREKNRNIRYISPADNGPL